MTTLKIYQADEQKAEEMDREAQEFRRITMKVLTMQLNSTSVMDIVAMGGAAVGMIVAVSEFLAGSLDFSETLTIILLASEFFIPLRLLGSFFHIAMNGMTASDKIFRLLDLEEPKDGEEPMPRENFDIELWKVGFSYEKRQGDPQRRLSYNTPGFLCVSCGRVRLREKHHCRSAHREAWKLSGRDPYRR